MHVLMLTTKDWSTTCTHKHISICVDPVAGNSFLPKLEFLGKPSMLSHNWTLPAGEWWPIACLVCVWVRKKRSCHGTKRRWRDAAKSNVEAIGVGERWYELCQDRKGWLEFCWEGVEKISEIKRTNVCPANACSQTRMFICDCGCSFRRQGDLTRHSRFCSHCD